MAELIIITIAVGCLIAVATFGLIRAGVSTEAEFYEDSWLGGWRAGLSGAASAQSGWLVLGLVGVAYTLGLGALWFLAGCIAGYLFNWFVVAPKLEGRLDEGLHETIISMLVENDTRWDRAFRVIAGLLIAGVSVVCVAAQLGALGAALSTVLDLPQQLVVVVVLASILAYLAAGAFQASVWTDVVQASLVLGVLVVLPLGVFVWLGADGLANLRSVPGMFDLTGGHAGLYPVALISVGVGMGLGYCGQPPVLMCCACAGDYVELRRAGIIASCWAVIVFAGAIAVGIGIRAAMPGLKAPEHALSQFSVQHLPTPVAGVVLAMVLAAICATVDSQLLVASSALNHDVIDRNRRARLDIPERVMVVGLGLVAGALACFIRFPFMETMAFCWAVLGAAIGPVVVGWALLRRTSTVGLLAGCLLGISTLLVWKHVLGWSPYLYELVPAFAVGLAGVWIVRD